MTDAQATDGTPATGPAPAGPLPGRRRWPTLAVLCLSLLIIGMDNTVMNTALPTVQRALDASSSGLQWIVDAYTLTFAALLLCAGAIGDRFGRKRTLETGLFVFGGASVWGMLCHTADQLIAARAVMGVGGALIMPATLSILTNVFTDPRERKRAIGIWSAASGVGIAGGPALGGWLLAHYYWGSVLFLNIPVVVVAIATGFVLIDESRDSAAPRVDVLGGLLSVLGLTAGVWAIIEAPSEGWTDPRVLGAFGIAAVVLGGFVAWEHRAPEPMLPLGFFRSARFTASAVSVTLIFFALFGSVYFLSIYLQSVVGYTPLQAGVRVTPIAIGLVFGAPLAMWAAQRIGEKIPVVVGMSLLAIALWLGSGFGRHTGYGWIFVVVVLIGLGISVAMAPATEAVMGSLPRSKAGVGSAVNDATRQVGGTIGVAVLGSILNSVYAHRMASQVRGLPPRAADPARNNLQAAQQVAARLPHHTGSARLLDAATGSFVHAMADALLVAALVAAAGAVIALVWLPRHGTQPAEPDTVDAASTGSTPTDAAAGAVRGPDASDGVPARRGNHADAATARRAHDVIGRGA